MRQHILRTALLVGALCVPAFAQLSNAITVSVPFDFQVGHVKYTAGDYSIDRINLASSAIRVTPIGERAVNVPPAAVSLVYQDYATLEYREPKVLFTRYPNGNAFMQGIQIGMGGVRLPRGHDEIVTSTLSASVKPETVMVLARLIRK